MFKLFLWKISTKWKLHGHFLPFYSFTGKYLSCVYLIKYQNPVEATLIGTPFRFRGSGDMQR